MPPQDETAGPIYPSHLPSSCLTAQRMAAMPESQEITLIVTEPSISFDMLPQTKYQTISGENDHEYHPKMNVEIKKVTKNIRDNSKPNRTIQIQPKTTRSEERNAYSFRREQPSKWKSNNNARNIYQSAQKLQKTAATDFFSGTQFQSSKQRR